MLKVLLVASECVPFSKTGGLADVVGALPKELHRQGVDARVITPLYRSIPDQWRSKLEHMLFFYVNLGWRRQYVGIERLELDGVTYYFIDNEYYFGRSYIYGLGGDEGERFAYFCRAVLEALPQIDFMPDVLHLNDWQTGLIAPMLEVQYRVLPLYQNLTTVYTVHNLQYQGLFPIGEIEDLVSLGMDMYTSDKLEFYGQCSFMKAERPGLVVLDELAMALYLNLADQDKAMALIQQGVQYGEVVVTGRYAPQPLMDRADYISQILKIKHPYDQGVSARQGIEF